MATSRKTPAKPAVKSAANKRAPAANKWAGVQLPEGFVPISSGEFGDPWDFESDPVVVGTIDGDTRNVVVNEGKRTEYETRAVTVARDDGTRIDVWESASLKGWFDAISSGMSVSLAFQGYRDVGKPSPMKVFVGAIAEGEVEEAPARKPAAKKAAAKKSARR